MKLELYLLGKVRVVVDGRYLTDTLPVKAQALLCYLAVTGEAHTRHALAGLLWGDASEEKAKNSLRVALAALRKVCPDHLIVTHQTIAFNQESQHWLDVDTFVQELREGRLTSSASENDPSPISLYRGDFLEDLSLKDAEVFAGWVLVQRAYWRQQALRLAHELSQVLLQQRFYPAAIEVLQKWLAIEPWQEEAHSQLMLAYGRIGNYNAALSQYETCRSLLQEELGVEPTPTTTALYERIQISRRGRPYLLPQDNTSFISREMELQQLHQMLTNPDHRLVTITGLGGAGKTRLALAAAQQANQEQAIEFLNGVVFVSLAGVATAKTLPQTIASALDIPLIGKESLADELINFLQRKEMLLVLDNFEHLLDGIALLQQILKTCPNIKILVTSREPLYLTAEWRLDLEGLAYPVTHNPLMVDDLQNTNNGLLFTDYPAVQLFIQAVQQVWSDYEPAEADIPHIVHLCRLVAGMPLALKLAATWLRMMTCEQLVTEIRHNLDVLATQMHDVPPRQRSMRAIFDTTWSLLTEPEQQTFAALSVFHGGFHQEAAVQVANATLPILATLIEKSLLRLTTTGQYQMHELVRQFASTKLSQMAGAETISRDRHAAYYLHFLQLRQKAVIGQTQGTALTEIGAEIDNIQAGWRWAVRQNNLEAVLPAIETLFNFYQIRSRFQEGESLFAYTVTHWQQTVALDRHHLLDDVMVKLLARWGVFSMELHDFAAAQHHFQDALNLSDHPEDKAFVWGKLGWMALRQGQRPTAEKYLHQSLEISRDIGDQSGVVDAWQGLTNIAFEFGDIIEAVELGRRSLKASRQLARPDWIARALSMLAWPLCCIGAYVESEVYFRESLTINEAIGDPLEAATAVNFLGWIAWCTGGDQAASAISYHEKALATYRELAHRERMSMCLGDLGLALLDQEDFDRAVRYVREGLALARETGIIHLIAYNLSVLGAAFCELRELTTSRHYLVEALQVSWGTGKTDQVMNILLFFAQLLRQESETISREDVRYKKREQAFALLALVAGHPSTWQVFKDRAIRLQDVLAALSPEMVAKTIATPALYQGRPQQLQQLVKQLIDPNIESTEET